MQWNGDFFDVHPEQRLERLCGAAHRLVDVSLRLARPGEALGDDTDAQVGHLAGERLAVALGLVPLLSRVHAVGAGHDLEHHCAVLDGACHRAEVVERDLDGERAGVGHQAMGRFEAVDPAPACRHANRPTLITADRHVDLAARNQRRAAGRGTAGGVFGIVRVAHGAGIVGVAAAREAQVLAYRFTDDLGAGVEQTGDHRRVDVGHVALEYRSAVHHRHAGDADVVLDRDGAAFEPAAARAADGALVIPGAERVLGRFRAITWRARILHRRLRLGEFLEAFV